MDPLTIKAWGDALFTWAAALFMLGLALLLLVAVAWIAYNMYMSVLEDRSSK